MKPIKQLAGQTAIYGMGTIVPRLLNYLLLTPFYTRIFLQGEYGVITELYAYVAFLMVLLTYGMETAFFRYAELEKDKDKVYSTVLTSVLTTSVLFLVLIISFLQPVANLIQYSANKEYILLFAFIVAIDAFVSIPFARLRQQNKAFRFAAIRIISVCVNIGLNLFFYLLCPHLLSVNPNSFVGIIYTPELGVGYAFISNLAASIVAMILLSPEIFRIKWIFDKRLLRKLLSYGLPLLVVGLAGMVNEVADKVLLKYLVTIPDTVIDKTSYAMSQVGIYGANFKLAVLMTLFIQMFRYAAEPFFFAQAKSENPQKTYADVMKYFVIFCLLIFLGVTLYIDIFKYFIGPDFRSGLHIVPVVLMANLFLGVFYNLSVWYKLTNLTRYAAYIALMGSAITVMANIILVPIYGYTGSAWGHFACYLVMVVVSFYMGRKHYKINYDLKKILGYFSLALLLFLTSMLISVQHASHKILIHTGLILIFLLVVLAFERKEFRKMV